MRHRVAIISEAVAVCLLGIMGGFFFAVGVVPAMENLDASGYITTQQWINRAVRNAVFGATYFGSALMPFVAAAFVFWSGGRRRGLAWLAIALVYVAAVFWITRSVNIPINNELAAWHAAAPPLNWQEARDTWNQSNLVRTTASVTCFICSVVLLTIPKRP